MTADLTVVIPARAERWVTETVIDVLAASGPQTTVLVVLDEDWPETDIPSHPRLDIIRVPKARGQRAATNLGIRTTRTRYVMKLDAHCAMAPGFDEELMRTAETLGPRTIQIPLQYNLHVFNRVCRACGFTEDMGPTWPNCPQCKAAGTMTREVVWQRRMGRRTSGWMFDKDLHFQYWGEWSDRHADVEVHDVMSCLGACWVVDREWYWSVGGLDEAHGSWGQMGTELACKAWLSGGRMVCNKRTWFAHMFRTQGGDFGFPYPLSGKEVSAARAHSRKLWMEGTWPQAVRPLGWLLAHFQPFPVPTARNPSWTAADLRPFLAALPPPAPTKGIVWYSDAFERGDAAFQSIVQASWAQLAVAAPDMPVVAVVLGDLDLAPRPHATIIRIAEPRGYLTMFRQILTGLEALTSDVVYLCEHDVLYAPEHFARDPIRPDRPTYNQAVWKVSAEDGRALHYRCSQTSGLSCARDILITHYRQRIARVAAEGQFRRTMGFEPGTRQTRHGGIDDLEHDTWQAPVPNVDIRHGSNLTPSRWRKDQFRHQRFTSGWTEADAVPGWGTTRGRFQQWLAEVVDNRPRLLSR